MPKVSLWDRILWLVNCYVIVPFWPWLRVLPACFSTILAPTRGGGGWKCWERILHILESDFFEGTSPALFQGRKMTSSAKMVHFQRCGEKCAIVGTRQSQDRSKGTDIRFLFAKFQITYFCMTPRLQSISVFSKGSLISAYCVVFWIMYFRLCSYSQSISSSS